MLKQAIHIITAELKILIGGTREHNLSFERSRREFEKVLKIFTRIVLENAIFWGVTPCVTLERTEIWRNVLPSSSGSKESASLGTTLGVTKPHILTRIFSSAPVLSLLSQFMALPTF
jgi:hypothetical protein